MGMVPVEFWWELGSGPTVPAQLMAREVETALGGSAASYLGSGSYGETWAIDLDGDRRAVKIIHEPNYPIAVLDREIEALRRGRSEFVVDLVDVRTVNLRDETRHTLVFEFIDGGDASSALHAGTWPTEDETRFTAVGLLTAVRELHSNEAIHRDIKLENLALRGGAWESPVLLDLGLAKMLDQSSLTVYPSMIGTLPYMSPEQVRGARAKQASDLWACGVVLYILVGRRHPFYGDRANRVDHSTALSLLEQGPQPLPAGVDPDFADLVEGLLSFRPHRRGSAARAVQRVQELM